MAKKKAEAKKEENTANESAEKKEKQKSKRLTFSIPLPTSKKVLLPLIIIVAIAVILLLKGPLTGFTSGPSFGDSVKLNYSIELEDGTVLDNGEQSFVLGSISSGFGLASDKLDQMVKSIPKGGEKTITLEPTEAFGEYNYSYIEEINRTIETNKTLEIPAAQIDAFKEWFNSTFGKEPAVGDTGYYITSDWNSTITSISDKGITLKHEVKDGVLPLLPSGNKTIKVTEDKIYITFNPGEDFPNVIDVTADKITLDYNSQYAGQKIIVKVSVEDITKKATTSGSTGKPQVELFVMTYCPYGTQAEKGIIPALKALGDKIDAKIRFVHYFMHGDQEEAETYTQVCIREEQSDKYLDYLECFLEDGDSSRCLGEIGIDENSLNTCIDSKAKGYYAEDSALSQSYSVQGSPTLVINGVQSDAGRSSQLYLQGICEAFSKAPSECSQALSAETPSAGFGYNTASSGSTASCG